MFWFPSPIGFGQQPREAMTVFCEGAKMGNFCFCVLGSQLMSLLSVRLMATEAHLKAYSDGTTCFDEVMKQSLRFFFFLKLISPFRGCY